MSIVEHRTKAEFRENRPARLWMGSVVALTFLVISLVIELGVYLKSGQTHWRVLPIGGSLAFFSLVYLTLRNALLQMPDL